MARSGDDAGDSSSDDAMAPRMPRALRPTGRRSLASSSSSSFSSSSRAPASAPHDRDPARMQRLMESADQSLDMLASWGELEPRVPVHVASMGMSMMSSSSMSVPPAPPSFAQSLPPLSTDSVYFMPAASGPVEYESIAMMDDRMGDLDGSEASEIDIEAATAAMEQKEEEDDQVDDEPPSALDLRVVDLAVERGLLHVKGVFPDHSVEYADMDPRFTAIGELKRILCEKRNTRRDLAFSAQEARIMFNGQLVDDDWLVVDCGLGIDGVIYVVKALPTAHFGRGFGMATTSAAAKTDPRLTVASIAASYGTPRAQPDAMSASQVQRLQQEARNEDAIVAEFNHSMALGSAQTSQLAQKVRPEETSFAGMLSDFYQHLDSVPDADAYCERLLRGYIDTLQARVEALSVDIDGLGRLATPQRQRMVTRMQELREERNTWRLLFELRRVCHANPQDEDADALMDGSSATMDNLRFDMTEDDAVQMLEARNDKFKIAKAVQMWLEAIAMERAVVVSDKLNAASEGSRSLKLLQKGLMSSDGIQLDPDVVNRQGDSHVIEDDAEDEAELLKGVWTFVRAGNLQEAVEMCVRVGQNWRAASLSGGLPVGTTELSDDRALERWGNPMRALWKTTCWKLAEHKNMRLSKRNSVLMRQYEEIVYAALSGNVALLIKSPLCESWEDHCWAYLHAMTEHQIDDTLSKLLKVKLQSSRLIVGNNAHYLRVYDALLEKFKYLTRYELDIDVLFEELKNSKSELVRSQANEPHRQIQAKLVTAQVDYIVSQILDSIMFETSDAYDWNLGLQKESCCDNVEPSLLRFAAHFVLFSRFTGEQFDEQSGYMIVKMYIRHLVKHGHLDLVPVYAARLPDDGAIEVYIQILETLEDRQDRAQCLQRVLEYHNMELLSTVVNKTVERMCTEYAEQAKTDTRKEDPITQDTATSRLDRKCMRAIEYLCFFNDHRAEALLHANQLARQFATERKFSAIKELFLEYIPDDSLGVVNQHRNVQTRQHQALERILREYLCWKAYIRASTHYDLWRSCISAARGATWSSYKDEKEFVTELIYHVSRANIALVDTLHFENGWMLKCSDNDQDTLAIRQACLPVLTLHLHFVQHESALLVMNLQYYPHAAKLQLACPLLEKAVQVADVVADEHYAISLALSPEHCQELLHRIRESAIAMLHMDSIDIAPASNEDQLVEAM